MDGIRIIELPAATMVTSGNRNLQGFDEWWSHIDKERKDRFFPRDFMWFDPENQSLVWYYALPDGVTDTGGYEVVEFSGGLYAAFVSRDQDDQDGQRVYRAVLDWVQDSGCFAVDERPGRRTLFHVITSDTAYRAMGYRQLDLYIPIRIKAQ
ncbi:MAG TPA: GyrI-like domain-containing protein [Symbiobacteriaceae bacterium]|nr:GyrI-like domain-containing protein [Symbiobacteriaceae bacterium]